MFGDWFDADRMSIVLIAGIACSIIAAVLVLRLIRKVALAVAIALVFACAAVALAVQWTGLRDCQETCSCEVFGQQVSVPQNPLCGPDRIDPANIDVDIDIDTGQPPGGAPDGPNLL